MIDTYDENYSKNVFENNSILKTICIMIIPAIISQLILSVYNIADTWYVGLTGNAALIAALSVSSPLFHMMTAISNLFGIGGASVIASYLGSRKKESARNTFKISIIGAFITAIVYSIIILLFYKPILMAIGSDATNINYASAYTLITIFIGSIPTIISLTLSHLIRAVGKSKISSFGITVGIIFNMIIDPILMFVILPPGYEILGTAIGTLLGNILTLIIFIVYLCKYYKSDVLTLNNASYEEDIFKEIIKRGLASFSLVGASMLSNCFLNGMIGTLAQSAAMAGIGITRKIDSVAYAVNQGIIQGILPIISYCYSAKKFERMKKVVLVVTMCTITFSVVWLFISYNFAPNLIEIFIKDAETIYYGVKFLRVFCVAISIYPLLLVIVTIFQSVGKSKTAFVLSLLHKGSIDIILFFVFRRLFGTINVIWVAPLVDVFGLVVAIIMYIRFSKKELVTK